MWRFIGMLFILTGCAKKELSPLESLITHEKSADKPFCDDVPPVGPSQMQEFLATFQPQFDAGKTGVYSIEDGAGALSARAWLTDNATETIEAQYFIFSADNVGLLATERLLLAAERGVKVRLLVDDLLAHGDAQLLLAVSLHPNMDVRIYNPNINIGKSLSKQITNVLTDFRGINQRMHNKTFIVDGQAVITGGRNVGDEYYDFHPSYNFRDRDILVLGAENKQIQDSFYQFWNSEYSVPIEKILQPEFTVKEEEVWDKMHRYACDPTRFIPSFRERIQKEAAFLSSEGRLHWVDNFEYISDKPGKNDETSTLGGGGKSTDALIALVKGAKKSVVMQTPYLVVTDLGLGLFAETVKRGVPVHMTTNSLLATDGLTAFNGYARVRKSLINVGVKIYEFRPYPAVQKELMTGPPIPESVYGLHAKTMVIDEEIAIIGTFNLDPRSANLNTEGIVIIRDAKLAKQIHDQMMLETQPENSWEVTKDYNPDQNASFGTRFKMFLMGFIPKSIL